MALLSLLLDTRAYVMSRKDLRVISRSFSTEALRDLKSDILLERSSILSESHSSFKDLLHLGADGPLKLMRLLLGNNKSFGIVPIRFDVVLILWTWLPV